MKKYPSIKDKVKVTDQKILEIKSPLVLANVLGKVGTVVGDHYNGMFDVEFDIGEGFTYEHIFYGDEIEVVEVAKCDCHACRDLEERFKEEQEHVAPDGSV